MGVLQSICMSSKDRRGLIVGAPGCVGVENMGSSMVEEHTESAANMRPAPREAGLHP